MTDAALSPSPTSNPIFSSFVCQMWDEQSILICITATQALFTGCLSKYSAQKGGHIFIQ